MDDDRAILRSGSRQPREQDGGLGISSAPPHNAAPGTSPGAVIAREPRIDILRGCALLTIVINHLSQVAEAGGLTSGLVPTPTRYGYSTAAELFVILSGYMVGLVYLARPQPILAVVKRAATLWLYNFALLAAVFPLAFLMSTIELDFWRFNDLVNDPLDAIVRMGALQQAPRLLDILLLYVTLMLIAPLAIVIHARSPRVLIAASATIYVVAQILTIKRIDGSPTATDDGILKLLSWQVIFFVPMALGARRLHLALFRWLETHRTPLVLFVSLFLAGALLKTWEAPAPEWLTPRYGLHLLRLGHAILVLMLYTALLTAARRLLHTPPARMLATIGRHSLDCFAAGVLATYVLALTWDRAGGGHLVYCLSVLTAVTLTALVAWWRESARKPRHRHRATDNRT
ncbi:OpgC domain-containing protein [Sphingomonas sp. IC4-52]|uniref:OpgC domain-containing protein n=1 Tax=Sphingomonas sp. IC4-52 TaxID=2887202 RepID=UPI001D1030FA|nr:OpgC domain-containing protein [Sphingomonas sp. IC4-52]MCC2978862.1 OpgC domain-containing protein [Sphingomonas sp. IC4-52]